MGDDLVPQLPEWKQYREIIDNYPIFVYPVPDSRCPTSEDESPSSKTRRCIRTRRARSASGSVAAKMSATCCPKG